MRTFFAGSPAVTAHRIEMGTAYHVGTNLDRDGRAWLLDVVTRAASVSSLAVSRPDHGTLELVERREGGDRWLFALNHGESPVDLALQAPAIDVLTATRHERRVTIPPTDLVILQPAG